MRIVGIDPGLKATGYGIIEYRGEQGIALLEVGTIEPKQKDLIEVRIHKIHTHLEKILKQYQPTVMVLEKLYAHYKHPTTGIKLGHARGVICLLCAQLGMELVEHSVKRIRKSIVGNGNATKQQTRMIVGHMLDIDPERLTLDASDALALALGHARMQ